MTRSEDYLNMRLFLVLATFVAINAIWRGAACVEHQSDNELHAAEHCHATYNKLTGGCDK